MAKCKIKNGKGKCGTCRIYIIAIAVLVIACAVIYIADYYHADQASIEVYTEQSDNEVMVETPDKDTTVFIPQQPIAGFIFYPGGKVEASAYEPLMTACNGT